MIFRVDLLLKAIALRAPPVTSVASKARREQAIREMEARTRALRADRLFWEGLAACLKAATSERQCILPLGHAGPCTQERQG